MAGITSCFISVIMSERSCNESIFLVIILSLLFTYKDTI